MTLGQRIKLIRNFRHLTMDELGQQIGFEKNTASVRIAQYESDQKKPKAEMIEKISHVLDCSLLSLGDFGSGSDEDLIETFFWMEEENNFSNIKRSSTHFKYEVPENIINMHEADKDLKKDDHFTVKVDSGSQIAPMIALTFNRKKLNQYITDWYEMKADLLKEKITPEAYFEWKIHWSGIK